LDWLNMGVTSPRTTMTTLNNCFMARKRPYNLKGVAWDLRAARIQDENGYEGCGTSWRHSSPKASANWPSHHHRKKLKRKDGGNSGSDRKMVHVYCVLIFSYLSISTVYNILIYIYLYLKVINISKSRKFPRDLCKT